MMKISPCKDCGERETGCHAHCQPYIQWAEEQRKIHRRIQETVTGIYTPSATLQKIYWRNKKKDRK